MYFNGFQNPKLAAIRLIRSQGCCQQCAQQEQMESQPVIVNVQLQNLLRYKEQLQAKVTHQRMKMSQIPCAIQLSHQIDQLHQIIEGLTRQNQQRMRIMQNVSKEVVNTTLSTELEDDDEDVKQNERLQAEYNMLMRKLEKTNDKNTHLVNRLINF